MALTSNVKEGNHSCCVFSGDLLSSVLPPLLIVEFALGVLGNGIALWIFCFHFKPWKTSTVYLFNLALADFLLNVVLPFRTDYYLRNKDWIFGDVFCSISLFLLTTNRAGSILFLTAVAVDRYFKVVHPHHAVNTMALTKAVYTACVLWVLAISMTVYLLTKSHEFPNGNLTQCDSFTICPSSTSDGTWHNALFVLEFCVSLSIVLYCSFGIAWKLKANLQDKQARIRKALKLVTAVVVLFVVCFLPSNVTRILIWIKKGKHINDCDSYEALDSGFYITISLTYLNSMLDPLVYYFSSPTFKKYYIAVTRHMMHKKEDAPAEGTSDRDTTRTASADRL
ncbi:hydroxycarboxylic acid receptor 2-like [Polyodon spathula]|uniref:hydroxycarboxylic acid receptor 2-like n=1 Tax=Polyodon spathula TaxID=7913 RepID=UPI001B7DD25A|nr:hydroxycarboxylic acid receptor 2-like [Polyodon spathula]